MNLGSFSMLFMVLVLIVTFFTVQQKDGFQIHIPETIAQKNLVEASTEDYAPSYVLATGPAPGGVASFNSLPYIDPSQEKAKFQRILNVQTTLQGFLDNEASTIKDMSDPAIQLPLSSARSDLTRLKNEVLVLKRNPGIDSMITQEELDGIQANLAYLQKKWRMSLYNEEHIEGFRDSSGSNLYHDASGSNASLTDLDSLVNKIDATITRLTISGTTDPIVLSRVNILKQYKNKVQAIIQEVVLGARKQADIPITKDAYNSFLKTIADVNSPVNKLFGNNTSLSDLFPAYSLGDVSGASVAQYLFGKYSDMLMKGLSFDVNINYASEAEQGLASAVASTLGNNYHIPSSTEPLETLYHANLSNASAGQFTDVVNNLQKRYFGSNHTMHAEEKEEKSDKQKVSNVKTQETDEKLTGKLFNWHERANFICESIEKRGLNPDDFACLHPDQYVSEDFSWRGYAKMVCSRLGTSYDTGLPEVCGCPPTSWIGWKP